MNNSDLLDRIPEILLLQNTKFKYNFLYEHVATILEEDEPPCFVQLGRYGDLLNILPVLRFFSVSLGKSIPCIVHKRFIDIFEGVSYVIPISFEGELVECERAIQVAKSDYRHVICTQMYGNSSITEKLPSFSLTMWQQAGCQHLWHYLPLIFDRRDLSRESHLVSEFSRNKPIVLVATNGVSSPFPYANELKQYLDVNWGGLCSIVDLDTVKAYRLYDILGLMDRAALLLATDSALLHLGYGAHVPTIGFTTSVPSRWHGTMPRRHWVANCRYEHVTASFGLFDAIIEQRLKIG